MKYALLLLSLVVLSSAQFFRNRGRRPPQLFRPQQQFFRGGPPRNSGRGGGAVDDRNGNSQYHFSWRHDGNRKYTGNAAHAYCNGLGGGWGPVAIETSGENNYINQIISSNRLEYIWTGAVRQGSGWRWINGGGFSGLNWSHTGGAQRPQPDNREGNESCLAILNNFYRDGIKWHDVACHHTKPIICERRG